MALLVLHARSQGLTAPENAEGSVVQVAAESIVHVGCRNADVTLKRLRHIGLKAERSF